MTESRTDVLALANTIVLRIKGEADDAVTARQARALARKLAKLAASKEAS